MRRQRRAQLPAALLLWAPFRLKTWILLNFRNTPINTILCDDKIINAAFHVKAAKLVLGLTGKVNITQTLNNFPKIGFRKFCISNPVTLLSKV